jgi:hypothetical protein
VFATDAVIYLWDLNGRRMAFVDVGSAKWDESCGAGSGFGGCGIRSGDCRRASRGLWAEPERTPAFAFASTTAWNVENDSGSGESVMSCHHCTSLDGPASGPGGSKAGRG